MSSLPTYPSVVVVEDSDEDFAAMARVLRRSTQRMDLQRFSGADQTISYLEDIERQTKISNHQPALILLDLNLPGRDGRYVLKELRSHAAWRKIPVVIFSTSSDPQDVTWCYENGANAYHVKNMNYDAFKQAVEQLSSYWLSSARIPTTQDPYPNS